VRQTVVIAQAPRGRGIANRSSDLSGIRPWLPGGARL